MENILPFPSGILSVSSQPVVKSASQKRSDRIIDYFLAGYFLGGLALAYCYDTWFIALGVGGISLLAYYLAKIALPESNLYQYILGIVLGIFMAQYIYQMHGLFEMHFLAFIGSAILIIYQNWKLQIPMMITVVAHHALFGYLQNMGFDKIYFTQLNYFALQTFLIHILLAAIIFFTSGLWAFELKKNNEIKENQRREMIRLQQEALMAVTVQKEQLERHIVVLDKAVAQGKFEIASDFMHDIGNGVIGFGSYLTKIGRIQDQTDVQSLQNLATFFGQHRSVMTSALGEAKADALVDILAGLAEKHRNNQQEISQTITEQKSIIANIEEILHIQRQYIGGQEAQERKPVVLGDIINDSLAIHFALIEKSAITISTDIPTDLPTINGDRTKLIQVVLNILKNSIEAIDSRTGERSIRLQARHQGDRLVLEIRDTGVGFDEAIGKQIFNRGFTTKAGAGLALFNARAIIYNHNGTIFISSEGPGKGALTGIRFVI